MAVTLCPLLLACFAHIGRWMPEGKHCRIFCQKKNCLRIKLRITVIAIGDPSFFIDNQTFVFEMLLLYC
jgi:hypothetical protein